MVDSTQSLGVVDPRTNRLTDRIAVGVYPSAVATGAGFVWVLNQGDTTVSKIDAVTRRVVRTIGLAEEANFSGTGLGYAFGAAWAPEGSEGTLTRISQWGAESPIRVFSPDASDTLLVATGAGAVWATSYRHSTVYRIDPVTRTRSAWTDVPATPVGIAVGERAVWVVSVRAADDLGDLATSGTLARIDPGTTARISAIPLPFAPSGIAVGFGSVWVTANSQDTVVRIDPRTTTIERMIGVGRGPTAVASDDTAVWVVNARSKTISRIDPETNTVAATIPVNGTPSAIASGEGKIWVTGA